MLSAKDKRKSKASVRWKFFNLSDIKYDQHSRPFYLENIPWTIFITRRIIHGVMYFGFFVKCDSYSEVDKKGSQYAEIKMRVLSQETGKKCVEKKLNHLFNSLENDWGFSNFLKWEEVLNPDQGYIKDDSVTVEVDLEIDAPNGDSKTIFRYTLSNVSKINVEQFSAPFYLQNMPWAIKVAPRPEQKDTKQVETSLRFFLQCNKESELWSTFANADLRLLSHNSEQDYINKKIEHLFNSQQTEADFGDFIDWQVVFNPDKGYIKNDSITLEINLEADAPKGESYNSELHTTRSELTFRLNVDNVSKMRDFKLSEPVYVGQLPWMIKVAPLSGQNEKKAIEFLGVFLQCNEEGESWTCNADAELRLLSQEPGQKHTRNIEHHFCSESKDWGFNRFMKWQDVLDPIKGFIKDDSITVEVYLLVKLEPEND